MIEMGLEKWVPLHVAAKALGVSGLTLTRILKRENVETRKNVFDARVTLVNVASLESMRYSMNEEDTGEKNNG